MLTKLFRVNISPFRALHDHSNKQVESEKEQVRKHCREAIPDRMIKCEHYKLVFKVGYGMEKVHSIGNEHHFELS